MKQIIRVKLSAKLLAKLREMQAQPSGLQWIPLLPGQPTPKRAKVTPEVDPVTELLDQRMSRVGGA